ncbi:NYN domain-containing protein [Neolewinella aurantiaca]|nr:NYN domain-containing protein [Neolewinella aurantiaca]
MSDIVAVFWDFEHFHQALMLDKHGHSGHKKANGRLQPKMVNVEAVMDFARSFGQVLTNEAFGNWHWMARYQQPLALEETTLFHVFPEDQYTPADVFPQMVARVKRFIQDNEDVTNVVLVGMDDDCVQLVEDLKKLGCHVHGLGTDSLKDDVLREVCDEFKDYYELPGIKRPNAPSGSRSQDLPKFYLRVAAQQGVRMPPPKIMWIGIDIYASFLRDFGQFHSFKELDDECYNQLSQDVPGATMTEVKKIRQVLFKCYLFRPSEDGLISFQEDIQTLADIEDCYFELMLKRIANNLREPTDYSALSIALTGADESADRLKALHEELNSKLEEEQ